MGRCCQGLRYHLSRDNAGGHHADVGGSLAGGKAAGDNSVFWVTVVTRSPLHGEGARHGGAVGPLTSLRLPHLSHFISTMAVAAVSSGPGWFPDVRTAPTSEL